MWEWKTSSVDAPVATTETLDYGMESPVTDGSYLVFDTDSTDDDACASVIVELGFVTDIDDFM